MRHTLAQGVTPEDVGNIVDVGYMNRCHHPAPKVRHTPAHGVSPEDVGNIVDVGYMNRCHHPAPKVRHRPDQGLTLGIGQMNGAVQTSSSTEGATHPSPGCKPWANEKPIK